MTVNSMSKIDLWVKYLETKEDPSKYNLFWGFTGKPATIDDVLCCVGGGWHELVYNLITDLFDLGWNGCVMQVKEKYGTLRFYIGGGTDAIFNRVSEAEAASSHICEACGNPGKLLSDGWWMVRCQECYEKLSH